MGYGFLDIAITPSVRAAQESLGVAHLWSPERHNRPGDRLGEDEAAFIALRDSFYLASVSETGWPYVQHRGGPVGFLRVIDETTLAFADYRGNRQYISLGNTSANDRVSLFLMDYPRRARLKILARLEALALDADPELTARVVDPDAKGKPERILRLKLQAFDWNCPQHITPRYTAAELAPTIGALQMRIAELEAELATVKGAP